MRFLGTLAGLSGASIVCVSLWVTPVRAATEEEKSGARAAATQGQAAFEGKRWAQAVDLFTRAEALVHSPVHLLYKARSLVQLGQLVKANETYLIITREQADAAAPAAVVKAREDARKEQAVLEPRLASLTVNVVGDGAASVTVTMDGAPVPSALVGVARPADPGQHTLRASGAGVESDSQTVTLKEGGAGTVTLQLKAAPNAVPPVATPAAGPVGEPPASSASVDSATLSKGNSLRTASYVAFGVGAVGLVAGTVFALKAKGKYSDGNDLCKEDPCQLSQADANRRDQLGKDGDSAKTLSIVGFVVGGVGVAAGTTLFVLSSKHDSEKPTAGVHPWIGLGSVGLSGRF